MSDDKKEASAVEITQVVTKTELAFKLPTGEVVGLEEYLVYLGNQILSIKKSVVGSK